MNKLNFGCGEDIKEDFVNVDIQKHDRIDKSFNFNKFPYPIKDNTFDYVWTKSVFEHIENPLKTLEELHRICKKDAIIEIVVPHYNSRSAYDSLDHRHYFSEVAFYYLIDEITFINKSKKFELIELKVDYSPFGKFIYPLWLRNKLSLLLNGIKTTIWIKLRVKK